eukprot:9504054-Pyramimonas_sp.AAC.3
MQRNGSLAPKCFCIEVMSLETPASYIADADYINLDGTSPIWSRPHCLRLLCMYLNAMKMSCSIGGGYAILQVPGCMDYFGQMMRGAPARRMTLSAVHKCCLLLHARISALGRAPTQQRRICRVLAEVCGALSDV